MHVLESPRMMFKPSWEGQEVLPEKAKSEAKEGGVRVKCCWEKQNPAQRPAVRESAPPLEEPEQRSQHADF